MFQVVDKVLMGEENVIAIGAASIGPVNIKEGKDLQSIFFPRHIQYSCQTITGRAL